MYGDSTDAPSVTCPPPVKKPPPPEKPPLTRSLTDSSIQYSQEERVEVSGTSNYVSHDGHLDLKVLLKVPTSILKYSSMCPIVVLLSLPLKY